MNAFSLGGHPFRSFDVMVTTTYVTMLTPDQLKQHLASCRKATKGRVTGWRVVHAQRAQADWGDVVLEVTYQPRGADRTEYWRVLL